MQLIHKYWLALYFKESLNPRGNLLLSLPWWRTQFHNLKWNENKHKKTFVTCRFEYLLRNNEND